MPGIDPIAAIVGNEQVALHEPCVAGRSCWVVEFKLRKAVIRAKQMDGGTGCARCAGYSGCASLTGCARSACCARSTRYTGYSGSTLRACNSLYTLRTCSTRKALRTRCARCGNYLPETD